MSKIREQAKLVRLYQQKYLIPTDLKDEAQNLRGLGPENIHHRQVRNKINYKQSSTVDYKLISQQKNVIMKSSGHEKHIQDTVQIDDVEQKMYNSSLPLRIPQIEYKQAEPCYRNILTRINRKSYHRQSPEKLDNSLKNPSRNLKTRPQTTNNHSMRSGAQLFPSKQSQSKWLSNFKQFFLKNGKRSTRRSVRSQQVNRKSVSHYLEVNLKVKGEQVLNEASMRQSLKSAVRTQQIRHTKEQRRASDKKDEKYRQYSQRSNIKTIYSKTKPNIKQVIAEKRVNNNQSELKPWNYEIEQF